MLYSLVPSLFFKRASFIYAQFLVLLLFIVNRTRGIFYLLMTCCMKGLNQWSSTFFVQSPPYRNFSSKSPPPMILVLAKLLF